MHSRLHIVLRPNGYMLLAWALCYFALTLVLANLPSGGLAPLAWLLYIAFGIYSLIAHVLLRWPVRPGPLECQVDKRGKVWVDYGGQPCPHKFVWCSQRLVVLLLMHPAMRWIPQRCLWLSPHNTSRELHRELRIIARFGDQLPIRQDSKEAIDDDS